MPPSGPILNEKLWHFHRTALLDYLFHQLGPLCLGYLHQPRLHHRGNGRRLQDGDEDGDGGLSYGEFLLKLSGLVDFKIAWNYYLIF